MRKPNLARDCGGGVWEITYECFGKVSMVMTTRFNETASMPDVLAAFLKARPDLRATAVTFQDNDLILITEPRTTGKQKEHPQFYIFDGNRFTTATKKQDC